MQTLGTTPSPEAQHAIDTAPLLAVGAQQKQLMVHCPRAFATCARANARRLKMMSLP